MTTLVLRTNPYLRTATDVGPGSGAMYGARVFGTEFVRAVLEHGSYERYCVVGLSGETAREHLHQLCPTARGRLECIDYTDVRRLREFASPVMAEFQSHFLHNRVLRRLLSPGRQWPVTGFIHSLNSQIFPMWFLQVVLGDAQPWDALICSSTAGRKVIENYFDAMPDLYPELRALWPLPRINCPVIPLGSDPFEEDDERRSAVRRQLGVGERDVLILYLGRFSPTSKGDLLPLLVAFAGLKAPAQGVVRMVLSGDDSKHRIAGALSNAAAELGCAASILVKPNPTEAEKLDLYAAADVFVSPADSLQETFGLTIIEAMAAGLPVIASDWNGYRDLVAHGETGFLVPTYWSEVGPSCELLSSRELPQDPVDCSGATIIDVQALRAQLDLLVQHRERRKAMGQRGRQVFFDRFQWKVVVRQYEALWDELQARARRAAPIEADVDVARQLAPRRIFAHYPSERLSDTACVAPGIMGSQLQTVLRLSEQMSAPQTGSLHLAQAIVDEISRFGSRPIAAVVQDAVAANLGSESAVRVTLARLLKYAIVQPATAGDQDATGPASCFIPMSDGAGVLGA